MREMIIIGDKSYIYDYLRYVRQVFGTYILINYLAAVTSTPRTLSFSTSPHCCSLHNSHFIQLVRASCLIPPPYMCLYIYPIRSPFETSRNDGMHSSFHGTNGRHIPLPPLSEINPGACHDILCPWIRCSPSPGLSSLLLSFSAVLCPHSRRQTQSIPDW